MHKIKPLKCIVIIKFVLFYCYTCQILSLDNTALRHKIRFINYGVSSKKIIELISRIFCKNSLNIIAIGCKEQEQVNVEELIVMKISIRKYTLNN